MAQKLQAGRAAKVGAGAVAAAALGAAAALYFYGKNGPRHRAQTRRIATRMYHDLKAEARKLKRLSKADYERALRAIAKKYQTLKRTDQKLYESLMGELKRHWKHVERAARAGKTTVAKRARRVARRAKRSVK